MLAELCQITSILSNVCIFLGVSWLAIKYFQFKKILYIIKMATDQIDQLLQDAVQDATLANFTAANITADISADTSKEKEKLILVVASGKSKQFLGKLMTTADIETLSDEDVQKLYARYEATLGGLITKQLKYHMCYAYSRVIQSICPTLNCKIEDIGGLTTSLGDGPFIDLALSSYTCKLYHDYGHLLAPIEAAIITSGYLSKATPVQPEALVQSADLQSEASPQPADLQSEDE